MENNFSKKAQVTIFVIIAIVIVVGVVLVFIFKDDLFQSGIPSEFSQVYNSFLSCVEENTLAGINLLESRGGYIELPDFEQGSTYMPFSSQLDFLGVPVPYWYYISGKNIQKEQVPTKSEMEIQLENYIAQSVFSCRFDEFYKQGFEIDRGIPKVNVKINSDNVEVNLDLDLVISKEDETAKVENHKLKVESFLGSLYDDAIKIYNYEQKNLFLENYAVDTLRLYAPVDGVDISCSPKTWSAEEIFGDLKEAIEINTLAMRVKENDYKLKSKESKYFVVDLSTENEVRFFNSRDWVYNYEVSPAEGSILLAKPVGNQPGLGILGFCYIPYHFVYSIKYPVLVQVFSGEEIFQFPVAVVIQGNNPREALETSAVDIGLPELCEYKNSLVNVNVYDTNLNNLDAEISFECFGTKCDIGQTKNGNLRDNFPQCSNGYVLAKAEGYRDGKYLYSTVSPSGSVDIILDSVYEKEISLKVDGRDYSGEAIISFISSEGSTSIIYPAQKSAELSEGQYEIVVYVYKNSSLKLEATTTEQCVEVPQSGIGSLFGLTKEKCYDVEIPEQIITNVLAGGGNQNYYILESELQSGVLEINAQSLPTPSSIESLQTNYDLFETRKLGVNFI